MSSRGDLYSQRIAPAQKRKSGLTGLGFLAGLLTAAIDRPAFLAVLKNLQDRLVFFSTGLGSRQIVHIRLIAVVSSSLLLILQRSLPLEHAVNQLNWHHCVLLTCNRLHTHPKKILPAPTQADFRITSSTGRVTFVTTPVWIYWIKF